MDRRDTEYPIEIYFGHINNADDNARAKKLHGQLSTIMKRWEWMRPAAKFKMIQDSYGQIYVKMNKRMLAYILAQFSELDEEKISLDAKTELPPDWFIALFDRADQDS